VGGVKSSRGPVSVEMERGEKRKRRRERKV
jgi:hypothetical protein